MKSACVFSINDAYVMPFQVFFHSLEATQSIPLATPIFILHSQSLAAQSISLLQSFLARYGREANFLDATRFIPANLPIRSGDHVSAETFFRLFIAEILPSKIEQAVYLDVDMLALRCISPLFEESVSGLLAAADHFSPWDEIRLWGERGGTYFQAGVLVIPLERWRQESLHEKFLEIMNTESSRIHWHDQDILNIVLADRWSRLPIWWNVCESVCRSLPVDMLSMYAALIHYSGSCKPWNSFHPSPFTSHWDQCFYATFGQSFDRSSLRPPKSPLRSRLKGALRVRMAGLIDWFR